MPLGIPLDRSLETMVEPIELRWPVWVASEILLDEEFENRRRDNSELVGVI